MSAAFTLDDVPAPFQAFMAGAQSPEILVVIPLEAGEDLTGAAVELILVRDTTDPDDPDVLERPLTLIEHIAGQHWAGGVEWEVTDLIEGENQEVTIILERAGGERELLARFTIDVVANPDPNP